MKTDYVLVKESKIEGKGVFAIRNFKKGEIVLYWDTKQILEKDIIDTLSEADKKYITVINGHYTKMQEPEKFVNHSCEPNTYVDNFCDVALQNISEGEEITSDYTNSLPDGIVIECNCGRIYCRGVIKK